MYGRPVSLTFHGQEKFKTPIGAILTVLVISALLAFTASSGLNLAQLRNPILSSYYEDSFYKIHQDLDKNEILRPGSLFFFGLGPTPVSSSIGRFVVKQIYTNRMDKSLNYAENLPVTLCSKTKYASVIEQVQNSGALYCLEDYNSY